MSWIGNLQQVASRSLGPLAASVCVCVCVHVRVREKAMSCLSGSLWRGPAGLALS